MVKKYKSFVINFFAIIMLLFILNNQGFKMIIKKFIINKFQNLLKRLEILISLMLIILKLIFE